MNANLNQFWCIWSFLRFCVMLPILATSLAGCNGSSSEVPLPATQTSSLASIPMDAPALTLSKTQISTPSPAPIKTPIPDLSLTISPTAASSVVSLVKWAEWKLDEAYYAAWLPDSQGIVFTGVEAEGSVANTYLYNVFTLQLIWQINDASSLFAISPDGNIIVGDGLQFWDAHTGQVIAPLYGGNATRFPAFLPDGSALLVGQAWYSGIGDSKSEVAIWDNDLRRLNTIIEQEGYLDRLTVSPDGKLLAAALGNILDSEGLKHHEVYLWDLVTNNQRCAFQGNEVTFNPTGNILAIIEKGEVRLYDTNTCQFLKTLYKSVNVSRFAYNPDGETLALVSSPRDYIRILDATSGELLYEQGGSWDAVWQLAYSPDGKFLMSRESYGTMHKIHVWSVITTPIH